MAKTPGSSDSKKTKGKKTQFKGSNDLRWGGSKIDTPGVHGSGFGFPASFMGNSSNAGGKVGVGPSGAKRGRPPGVKNGQGRGKK